MKFVKKTFFVLVAIYLVGCVLLYFFQDKLLFEPQKLEENYAFRVGQEVEVNVDEDLYLNCLLIKDPSSKGVILYLHGNRGSNRRCLRQAEMMVGTGYDIFMPDYRGFGKSEGDIISQAQLLADAQKVYDHLKTMYDESQIVILGYSLGTGLGSYLAANNHPKHLFLVAPYMSFIDMKNRMFPLIPNFLVKYPLNNDEWLKSVTCPVTLYHGTDDEIIPFDSSIQLAQINPSAIHLVKLDDTGHRRSIFHDSFRRNLLQALN